MIVQSSSNFSSGPGTLFPLLAFQRWRFGALWFSGHSARCEQCQRVCLETFAALRESSLVRRCTCMWERYMDNKILFCCRFLSKIPWKRGTCTPTYTHYKTQTSATPHLHPTTTNHSHKRHSKSHREYLSVTRETNKRAYKTT